MTLCSRAAEEADKSRCEAEKNRTLAEARALESKGERDAALVDKEQISEELHNMSKEVHTHLQWSASVKLHASSFSSVLMKDVCPMTHTV